MRGWWWVYTCCFLLVVGGGMATAYTTTSTTPTPPTTTIPTSSTTFATTSTTASPTTPTPKPSSTSSTHPTVPPRRGKIWAVLVASSTGYFNYRHQADVCHAYQILHANGIPDEQIVVMMPDDIAYNPENPTAGVIINSPGGDNVYEGVPKDYTGKTVTAENFLNILSGNRSALEGVGSGKIIESGPDDYIFVNFVDHGGPGILCFGESDILTADDLVDTLTSMHRRNKFAKMFLYIEACHSGSMFDDILPDNNNSINRAENSVEGIKVRSKREKNAFFLTYANVSAMYLAIIRAFVTKASVIVMTAADPHENSFACYYDEKRQTYLADVFSATWMHDTEHERLMVSSLHHQFERVRTWTNTSHVEEYGDLTIGSTHLSSFLGFNMDGVLNSVRSPNPPTLQDLVSSIDVPIKIMDNIIEQTKDTSQKRLYKLKKHHMLKMRRDVDNTIQKLVSYLAGDNEARQSELKRAHYFLGQKNMPCYKKVLRRFSNRCFNVAKHSYLRVHLAKLVNMCDAPWITTNNILDAISGVCDIKIHYSTNIM